MTIENKIKRVRELAETPVHRSEIVARHIEYRTLAPELANECERLEARVKALKDQNRQDVCHFERELKLANEAHQRASGRELEVREELKALKAKQVDLIAKAYDEGRNYVDDRGSEE